MPPIDDPISLNNLKITSGLPIYDDGFLIIFGIKNNLNFYPLIIVNLVASPTASSTFTSTPASQPSTSSLPVPQIRHRPQAQRTRLQKTKSGFFWYIFFCGERESAVKFGERGG
ncbi:hypothetical protein C1H46_002234 [Malus baccata]|uniref:Uncharacterized protein n=1 Tax=Malus baccata TaxID=106549 RepID=A0A540NMC8_MALBA|nr:hypothetical protein C1H46_002234 [Malus baccata]